jgi:hypothetical protein
MVPVSISAEARILDLVLHGVVKPGGRVLIWTLPAHGLNLSEQLDLTGGRA